MDNSTCVTIAHDCTQTCAPFPAVAARNIKKADDFADSMKTVFLELAYARKYRVSDVVRELNQLGIPTFHDCKWHRTTVKRMFERLGSNFEAERRTAYIKGKAALQTTIFGKPLEKADVEEMIIHLKNVNQQ